MSEYPHDWDHPMWDYPSRVHNWRNYATEELKEHWPNMTDKTKQIVAACLDDIASREEWE